jgi:glucuronate isomerase
MKPFIHDDFLLETSAARDLYHGFAADQPIIDYHCHLSPKDLAENRRFDNLYDVWLSGDHYKWRAMRLNGESERCCTGDAEPYDKFCAYARTVPATLRNPLYHWTHLELQRYFGIDQLLDEKSAPAIWEQANAALATDELSAWGILNKFKVEMIGTTDDPTDDLKYHAQIAKSDCPAKVLPSFRPDKAFMVGESQAWNAWVDQLEAASGIDCSSLNGLLGALSSRIEFFDTLGCVASDHGIEKCPVVIASDSDASRIFQQARSQNGIVSEAEQDAFAGFLLCWLGEQYAEKGWAMQLHLGAIRNVNAAIYADYGPDAGCDSIHDIAQVKGVATILGELSARGKLPKTILYNLDPAKNYAFATMCGNFFEEGVPGKVQFGSGWWFLDQLEGMTMQLNALSNLGLLSRFIGMLTDSRSFMSYPRHEYFRRLLCNMLGDDIEKGHLPRDLGLVSPLVSQVSYTNAKSYFNV